MIWSNFFVSANAEFIAKFYPYQIVRSGWESTDLIN